MLILFVYKDTSVVLKGLKTVQLLNEPNFTVPNLEILTAHLFVRFNGAKIISVQPTTRVLIITDFSS